jgi:hypothetical protein
VVVDYQQLLGFYAAANRLTSRSKLNSLWRSVVLAEERTSVDATASGLLACAPHPKGALGGTQS